MDGLLIDSEDKYTIVTNIILQEFGKPNLPWAVKAQLQGRPAKEVRTSFYFLAPSLAPTLMYL
jgi:pseudouridine-5'-monophosphatase